MISLNRTDGEYEKFQYSVDCNFDFDDCVRSPYPNISELFAEHEDLGIPFCEVRRRRELESSRYHVNPCTAEAQCACTVTAATFPYVCTATEGAFRGTHCDPANLKLGSTIDIEVCIDNESASARPTVS